MVIKEVQFAGGWYGGKMPDNIDAPCVAFIGRSNVGKSSLINMLLERCNIARVSKTPGKTAAVHFYKVNGAFFIVDLPGYGYAKVDKGQRYDWQGWIDDFVRRFTPVKEIYVLLDLRLPLQAIDKAYIEWLDSEDIPYSLIFTKADKVRKTYLHRHVKRIQEGLLPLRRGMPTTFLSSAKKKVGKEPIIEHILSRCELVEAAD